MKEVLIGSEAIKIHFPDFPREPKDLDIAVRTDKHLKYQPKPIYHKKVEYLVNPIVVGEAKGVASPELLLTLKMSHLAWNINFDKHMWDVQFLLKKGVKYDKPLFYELYNYWTEVHGKNKRSDLKMSKEDFFNNALKEFDHDYLHTLLNPTPTYLSMLADDAEVEIDENKFHNASDEDKKNLIKEEVWNMAYERFRHLPYKIAYHRMLKKYLFSHIPLFALPYLIENWIELHKTDRDFITELTEKLK